MFMYMHTCVSIYLYIYGLSHVKFTGAVSPSKQKTMTGDTDLLYHLHSSKIKTIKVILIR